MEDLERYLDEIAEPTVRDMEQNPTSRRHAFLACVAVFHAIDYLAFPSTSRGIRQQFGKRSPDFALVDKVAHAFKHVVTGARDRPDLTAAEVISRPPAYWGHMAWDLSRWGDATGGVTLDNDRGVDLLEVVKRAMAFLRAQTENRS